jgi:hypothetical protein
VHYEPLSVEKFTSVMLERDRPGTMFSQHFGHVAIDYRNGIFADTHDIGEKIGGQPPLSVEQFVTANKPCFTTSGSNFSPPRRQLGAGCRVGAADDSLGLSALLPGRPVPHLPRP